MVIFLTGATGLIGSAVARRFAAQGHAVICGVRNPGAARGRLDGCRIVPLDLKSLAEGRSPLPALDGVDVIVNAVGIFGDASGHDFQHIHSDGPIRLFDAAVRAGVRRIVQISALGADANARSAYHLTKRAADEALLAMPVSSLIVQPSLVFAPRGRSTRFLAMWATLPVVPLPGDGAQRIQPVHLDDLVDVIVSGAHRRPPAGLNGGERVAVVGPEPLSLRAYLTLLRRLAGGAPPRFVRIPRAWVGLAARLGERVPGSLISTDAIGMLERGNVAPADQTTHWLGHPPRSLGALPPEREGFGAAARLEWLLPLMRVSIAAVWIWTAIVSAVLYPAAASYALLARVGAPPAWQPSLLYGAALFDLLMGVLSLWWPSRLGPRARLWVGQIALIVLYTLLISWRLPEFWLHPYGPLSKNLPMIAALVCLLELDAKGRP
ncbi:SDR family oxidoreductase [Paraburkholderia sp.]|uniref:SDR family oxidoreductase n=1 Tax=Paraburkholderia sp. TaxID=1926495 RepID=UPI002F423662